MPGFKFHALPGFFVDYLEVQAQSPDRKVTTQPLLGLVDRAYHTDGPAGSVEKTPWRRFAALVDVLNDESPEDESYKVLYLTRHGMGFHNVMEAKVGTEAWDVSGQHADLMHISTCSSWQTQFLSLLR